VFVQDDDNAATHGSSADLAAAKRLRGNASEPLLWFKRDGRAYVIRDRDTIEKARVLFARQEELHKAMLGLEERQTILAAEQTARVASEDALRDQFHTLEQKLKEETANQQKELERQAKEIKEAMRKAAEEASLRDAETMRRIAAAQQEEVRRHQETLSMQQRMLGEQQAAVAAEQEVRARQLEELTRAMQWEMRVLFEHALAAGIATPVR
jgi:bla regulator protein blaR1